MAPSNGADPEAPPSQVAPYQHPLAPSHQHVPPQTEGLEPSWSSSLYAYISRLNPRRRSRARLEVERSSHGSTLSHTHRSRRGGTLDRGTGFYKEERQKLKMPHLVETGKCVNTRFCACVQ